MKTSSIVTASVLLASSAALAAEQKADVVVTATRDYRDSSTVPANVSVITSEDIEKSGRENVVDLLNDTGAVYFRSTSGNAAQSEIGMRGFGENAHGRVLVLMDGLKLNRPDMGPFDWLQIPLNNVERIEILRGASSALYGDHAVAGVINIITKKGTKEPETSLSTSYGSFATDAERIGSTGSSSNFSYAVNAEHQASDGYRDRSAFASWGAGGNVSYDVTDNLNLSLALAFHTMDYDLPGYLSKTQMLANPRQTLTPDDNGESSFFSATLGANGQFGRTDRAGISLGFGRKDYRSDMTSWASFADWTIDTVGITPRYMHDSVLLGHENKLTTGLDFYLDTLSGDRFSDKSRSVRTVSAEIDKTTLGLYARDEFSISKSLGLDAGVRTERAKVTADLDGAQPLDDSSTHHESAVDVSMIYTFADKSKLYGKFATVYRYPFLDEQVTYSGYGSDRFYADLEAETGRDVEIGAETRIGKELKCGLSLFLLDMEKEIAWNGTRNVNIDSTRRMGIETSVAWSPVRYCTLDANYTYTDAAFTEGINDGKQVPLVSPNAATVAALFRLPSDFSLRTTARYADATYVGGDYANAAEKLSSHTVVDVSLHYSPKSMKGFEAYVGADNVFDEKYAATAYVGDAYYPAPERTYRIGAAYRF